MEPSLDSSAKMWRRLRSPQADIVERMIVDESGRVSERPSRRLVLFRSLTVGILCGAISGMLALFGYALSGDLGGGVLLYAALIAIVVGGVYGLGLGGLLGLVLVLWLTFGEPTLDRARLVLSLLSLLAVALLALSGLLDAFIGLLAAPLAVVSTWIATRLVLIPSR